jgi:hypothetical protein
MKKNKAAQAMQKLSSKAQMEGDKDYYKKLNAFREMRKVKEWYAILPVMKDGVRKGYVAYTPHGTFTHTKREDLLNVMFFKDRI